MDSETQPLLADVEAGPAQAQQPQAPHICSQCSSRMGTQRQSGDYNVTLTWRLILILVAALFSGIIFALLLAQMIVHGNPHALPIIVTIWTDVTITILAVLLYQGRRPESKLGRTVTQIRILCALAVSWIPLMVGLISQHTNRRVCGYNFRACELFMTAHVFSWFLIVVLFGAAFATYRRAVKIHGSTPVQGPPVPAWRLSNVADGEGTIKI